MADPSNRKWKVKNGTYTTDALSGYDNVTGWYIISWNHSLNPPWAVLGAYSTEDPECCWPDDEDKWHCYLQDEAVRLAEEKELTPGHTILNIIKDDEAFTGDLLYGYTEVEDNGRV